MAYWACWACWAGKLVKEKWDLLLNIPIVGSCCWSCNVNKHYTTIWLHISVKIEKTHAVPKCMVINAHSLAKADAAPALCAELSSNDIDICFVSESWLNIKILSHLICPDGCVMVRKDWNGILLAEGLQLSAERTGKLKWSMPMKSLSLKPSGAR